MSVRTSRAALGMIGCAGIAGLLASIAVGFGTFRKGESYPAPDSVYGVALGDVNRDGRPDVVAGNAGDGVLVYRAKRSGRLAAPDEFPAGDETDGVAVGRFDPGKTLDIAAANYLDSSVSILHGKAGGDFSSEGNLGAGPGAWIIRAGDLDRDGRIDLVTGNYDSDGSDAVTVLPGNANGTFEVGTDYPAASAGINGLALGRMNGDRRPDVVAVDADGVLSVLAAKPDGSLAAAKTRDYTDGDVAYQSVALGDFNRDGRLDAAVQASDEAPDDVDFIRVFRGKGDGTFRAPLERTVPETYLDGLAAGHLDGDRKLDLVANSADVAGDGNYEAWVFRGRGNGRFRAPKRYASSENYPNTVAIGRIGADRGRDIVIGAENSVDVLLNKR